MKGDFPYVSRLRACCPQRLKLIRREDAERGAVAVIVAIMMVVILGCAAIAIDVSAMWAEKRQLQNGADAGALAIAQNCARGACGTPSTTAQTYAVANRNDGQVLGDF